MRRLAPALLAAAALLLAACGGDDSNSSSSSSSKAATTAASGASANACTKQSLKTQTPGTPPGATATHASPPYFENNDPKNGRGFESAVAYAVAQKLGYAKTDVKWVTEPFNSSYAPG